MMPDTVETKSDRSDSLLAETDVPMIDVPTTRIKPSMIQMLTTSSYSNKLLYTFGMYLSSFISGGIVGLKGPAFLDLQLITGVGTGKGAAFFTAASVGGVVGAIVGGAVYDRFNKHLSLFISTLFYGITCIMIPWCSAYWSMIMIFLIHELVTGVPRTGTNVEIVHVWGNRSKPFMQALHFMFSLGATFSPFLLDPFLAPPNSTADNGTMASSMTPDDVINTTRIRESQNPSATTHIHYAFLIMGLLGALSSLPFLIQYFVLKRNTETDAENNPQRELTGRGPLPKTILFALFALYGLFYFFLDEVEDTSPSFLSVYAVKQMGLTKTLGSRLTSAFWASYTAGRGVGVIFIAFVSHGTFFTVSCIILVLSEFGMMVSGLYQSEEGVWASIIGVGLSISVIFPASLTWTQKELLPLSGKIMAVIYMALGVGGLVNPQVIGITMELYSPMWYSYVLLTESILFGIVFIITRVFVVKVVTKYRTPTS